MNKISPGIICKMDCFGQISAGWGRMITLWPTIYIPISNLDSMCNERQMSIMEMLTDLHYSRCNYNTALLKINEGPEFLFIKWIL